MLLRSAFERSPSEQDCDCEERRGRKERESASQASEVDELTKTGMGVAGEGEHRYACYMRKSGVDGWMDGWMIQIQTQCVTAGYVRRIKRCNEVGVVEAFEGRIRSACGRGGSVRQKAWMPIHNGIYFTYR